MGITGIVHTRNSAATLDRALASFRWVDELIVVDMESTDDTRRIAERYADCVLDVPFHHRVDGVRNDFLGLPRHDWVFVLDSDEYLAADAADASAALLREEGDRFDAFAIPRFNYIAGQVMRGSGWYPDHQIRLFRKGTVRWADSHHEAQTLLTGKHRQLTLTPPGCLHIHHQNYTDLRHFIRKQVDYALTDSYAGELSAFDFNEYVAAAHEQLALRSDRERDGDLSQALALLMAWNSIVRGLVHWDSLSPRPPLGGGRLTMLGETKTMPGWRASVYRYLCTHHRLAHALRTLARPVRMVASYLGANAGRDG